MTRPVGAKTSMATPEVDEIDGFKFVAFERSVEVENYVKQSIQRGGLAVRHRVTVSNVKAGEASCNSLAFPRSKPVLRGAKPGKQHSILARHRKRIRKNDKPVITDKVHGFVFVSAFALEDLDSYDQEKANQSPSDSGTKRKSTSPPLQTQTIAAKRAKKNSPSTTVKFGKVPDRVDLETSNSSGETKPDGKKFTKHTGNIPSRHARKDVKLSPLSKAALDRLKKLSNLPVCNRTNSAMTRRIGATSRGGSQPDANLVKNAQARSLHPKKKEKHFPHMQIDDPIGDRTVISSDSEGSTIIISDVEENTYLDVCGIDDDASSARFIRNSMQKSKEAEDNIAESLKPKLYQDEKGHPRKRKKCKMCCAHPCRIVEAKKVSPLWGSVFPSYNVLCVAKCSLHPPGEIVVYPGSMKPGAIDTCIQTTASDIKMHQEFAQRFPHRTIAVVSHGRRVLDTPSVPILPKGPLTKRSEHHRTNEQKRREQLHNSFKELRKIISVTQAEPENKRASKQWILEHAKKAITSIEADGIFLSALKKNLEVKNARLKQRWKELSGRDFDPNERKSSSEGVGQSKLMDLYKKYRQDMQKETPSETAPDLSVANDTQGEPSEDRQPSQDTTVPKPSLGASVNKPPSKVKLGLKSSLHTPDKKWGLANITTKTSQAVSDCCHPLSLPVDKSNPDNQYMSQARAPSVTMSVSANSHSQTTSVKMSSQATAPGVPVSCQNVTMTTPSQPARNPSQPRMPSKHSFITFNKPSQIAFSGLLKSHQSVTLQNAYGLDKMNKTITQKKLREANMTPGQHVNQPNNLVSLSKQSHQAIAASKPTQWTTVAKLIPPTASKSPVEDVGAVVEVGDTRSEDGSHDKIVLLDVADTEDKVVLLEEPTRTLSLIPTSSSINVTLNSVGSITSNKIFNKTPVPSKSPVTLAKSTNNPVISQESTPKSGIAKDLVEGKLCVSSPPELTAQVLSMSNSLLPETTEGGKNGIESTSEPGLCVISNVFSLSDAKPGETLNDNIQRTCVNIPSKAPELIAGIPGVSSSTGCGIPCHGKESRNYIKMNGNAAMHDHNYHRYKLILPKQ